MNRPLGFDGGLSVLAEPDYLVQHSLGDFPLRGFWDFHDFIPGNDGNGIAIGVESYALARHIIDDDGVEILCDELPARVLQNIFSFGRKAHKDLSSLFRRNFSQDVGSGLQFQGHRTITFNFVASGRFGPVVRNGGRLDHDGRLRTQTYNRIPHLLSRLDSREFGGGGWRERRRTANQKDASPAS